MLPTLAGVLKIDPEMLLGFVTATRTRARARYYDGAPDKPWWYFFMSGGAKSYRGGIAAEVADVLAEAGLVARPRARPGSKRRVVH